MAVLGPISQTGLNSAIALSGCAIVQAADSDPVLELIASAVTTDYVHSANNATSTNTADVDLAWPGDLDSVSALTVQLQYLWQTGTRVNAWTSLDATIIDSGGTPLTDTMTMATAITATTATNSSVVNFTGVNTGASAATWLGAKLRISIVITKSMGGDTLEKRVVAAQVGGTYAAYVPQDYPLTANAGSYAITGGSASLSKDKSLTGDPGSYALTGGDGVFNIGLALTGDPGTYTITGGDGVLTYSPAAANYTLDGDPGTYAITGGAASLIKGATLQGNAGSYAITGDSASLLAARLLTADPGVYAITGGNADLSVGLNLIASAGTYSITGESATLTVSGQVTNYTLTADPGAYAVTGGAADLVIGFSLIASAGSYSITGGDADLSKTKLLIASPGTYALTGDSASMTISVTTSLSQSSIDAIAAAVWNKTLPLGQERATTYGATELSSGDLQAITERVWRQQLPEICP